MSGAATGKVAVYGITRHGLELGGRIAPALGADFYVSERFKDELPDGAICLPKPFAGPLAEVFSLYECHVFIFSVGAAVRLIAPHIKSKKTDPAVVCVDDAGQFAISLLSGHTGRGNDFTRQVAAAISARAVITTASDSIGTLTVDILGRELGWSLADPDHNVTRGCAAVVNANPVLVVQETGEAHFWPADQALPPGVQYATSLDGIRPEDWDILLVVTDRDIRRRQPAVWENAVVYHPRSLVLGIGCDKNTPFELVERGVLGLLEEQGLAPAAVRELASIDLKKEEPALLALSEKYGWPLRTFPAALLDTVEGIENPSEVVKTYTGCRAVAEAACLHAAGADRLLMPKEKYTEEGAERNMTLAIARVPFATRRLNKE